MAFTWNSGISMNTKIHVTLFETYKLSLEINGLRHLFSFIVIIAVYKKYFKIYNFCLLCISFIDFVWCSNLQQPSFTCFLHNVVVQILQSIRAVINKIIGWKYILYIECKKIGIKFVLYEHMHIYWKQLRMQVAYLVHTIITHTRTRYTHTRIYRKLTHMYI